MLQIVSFISVTLGFSKSRIVSTCSQKYKTLKLTLSFDVLLVLLLLLGFPLSGLDAVLPHGHGPVDPVQLEVETAGVTDRLPVVVPPPERGLGGVAVGAAQPVSPGGRGEHLRHRHGLEVHLQIFCYCNSSDLPNTAV